MRHLIKFLPIILLALAFAIAIPGEQNWAYAVDFPGRGDPDLKSIDENGEFSCSNLPEAKGGVLLGRMVPCIIYTIQNASQQFLKQMIQMMMPWIIAFMGLVGTFFGVRVLQGERQIGAHAFLLIFKMAMVLLVLMWIPYQKGVDAEVYAKRSFGSEKILGNMSGGLESVYGMMRDGVRITTTTLGPSSSQLECDVDNYGDANTPMIWKQMDCVLGKLYGFATGNGNTGPNGTKPVNVLLASSALGLLSGFFFGGTIGVAVFFALVGVLWSIALVVLRVVLAFINGYLLVCVMLLMTPLFLPLVLMKVTTDYFEKWWKTILSGMLMPVIIAAYSMFALLMYDRVLFEPDSLLQELFKSDLIGAVRLAATDQATQHSRTPCDFNVTNDPNFKAPANVTKAEMDKLLKNPFLQNFAKPLLTAGSDACGMFKVPVFDVTKVGADPITQIGKQKFSNARQVMVDMFHKSIQLFILAFLIVAGLNTVEGMVGMIVNSAVAGMASSIGPQGRSEQQISSALGNLRQNAMNAFNVRGADGKVTSVSGSEFIKQLPKSTTKIGTEFLGGLVRRNE